MNEHIASESTATLTGAQVALELRLLSGVHAGASLLMMPGESLTVGRSRDNDIVLHDAPFDQARLEAGEREWLWLEADGTRRSFKRGEGLSAGAIVLTLESAQAPWSAASRLPIGWRRPGADSMAAPPDHAADGIARDRADGKPVGPKGPLDIDSEPNAARSGSRTQGDSAAEVSSPASATPKPEPAPFLKSRAAWIAPGAVLVGVVWMAGSLGDPLLRLFQSPTVATPAATPDEPRTVATILELDQVRARLAAAGFNDVVRASLRPDGRIDVSGVVDNVDEQDQVISALGPERRWIALSLLTQLEFAERVREVSQTLPQGFEAAALPGGRVRMTGLAMHPEEGERVRALLEDKLPQAVSLVDAFNRPEQVAAQFGTDLQAMGFGSVRVAWRESRVSVDGVIPRARAAAWEQALTQFNQTHGDRLPARVALALADPVPVQVAVSLAQTPHPPPRLPRIVAIQSGALSYLLFADGSRVLPGGTINGYRLAGIGDTDLIFEDSSGTQHRVPR